MTNFSVVENKITSAQKYLKILSVNFKKFSRREIEENNIIKGSVERYLYLAAQSAIDIAESFISLRNFRKPTTLREGFEILEEEKIISVELREKMIKMTGFRNVVAHDYEKIDYDKVYDILQNRLGDIEEFVFEIKKALNL
ncbi:MAG: DUF86 domain-containing protein [Patescibacteria group bacterium]